MKITKLVQIFACFALTALLLIIAAGCKKSKNQPNNTNSLYGGWYEINTGANFQRTIYFEPGTSKFTMIIAQSGANPVTVSTYTGTYVAKNDSLKANITEEKVMQNNVIISTKLTNISLYEKGTYGISNNKLTLKYITYPADAPVNTEATFQRQLLD